MIEHVNPLSKAGKKIVSSNNSIQVIEGAESYDVGTMVSAGVSEYMVTNETELLVAWAAARVSGLSARIYIAGAIVFTANRDFIVPYGELAISMVGYPSNSFAIGSFRINLRGVTIENMYATTDSSVYFWVYEGYGTFRNITWASDVLYSATLANMKTHLAVYGAAQHGTGLLIFDTVSHSSQTVAYNNTGDIQPFIVTNSGTGFSQLYIEVYRMAAVLSFDRFSRLLLVPTVSTALKVTGDASWFYHPAQQMAGTGFVGATSEILKNASLDRVFVELMASAPTTQLLGVDENQRVVKTGIPANSVSDWNLLSGTKAVINDGALYNWFAVSNAKNIAPIGYHVPSKAEADLVNTYLNGAVFPLQKFSGRRSGSDGGFMLNTSYGFAWTNGASGTEGYYVQTNSEHKIASVSLIDKKAGCALRYIKDDNNFVATCTGNDGKVYQNAQVGTQIWTEAVAETQYRDGTLIPIETGDTQWRTASVFLMCYYANTIANAFTLLPNQETISSGEVVELAAGNNMNIVLKGNKVTFNVIPAAIVLKLVKYTAFLSQIGTAAPTAVVRESTLLPILSRFGAGEYDFTLAGAFTVLKTGIIDDVYYDQLGNKYTLNRISDDVVRLRTYAVTDTTILADNVLVSRYINIESYVL